MLTVTEHDYIERLSGQTDDDHVLSEIHRLTVMIFEWEQRYASMDAAWKMLADNVIAAKRLELDQWREFYVSRSIPGQA